MWVSLSGPLPPRQVHKPALRYDLCSVIHETQRRPTASAVSAGAARPYKELLVVPVAEIIPLAAAGWAFLVWLFGGGLGLAVVVFIVLKLLGK